MTKALFLDRDGTINIDYGYVHDPGMFVFINGVFEFCRKASRAGYLIIVITNQSGIERKYFSEQDFARVTKYMRDRFLDEGVVITDVFHCPSLSGSDRKPEPGMYLAAKEKYNIDMEASLNIGDSERDIEAGRRAGVGRNELFIGDFGSLEHLLHCSPVHEDALNSKNTPHIRTCTDKIVQA